MAVIGLDDTDSREQGMCTTYVAARLASRLREEARSDGLEPAVSRPLLVRLNPAVPHKTRGNAALALAVDLPVDRAFELARDAIEAAAETDDGDTHPGLVVAPGSPRDVPDAVAEFYRAATGRLLDLDDALALIDDCGYRDAGWKTGRGRIGALGAVGATRAPSDPAVGDCDRTYELIAYREPARWGTPRSVAADSVFAADAVAGTDVWDTVDRGEGEAVCVPHTPGPVLYGVRGDDPGAVRAVAGRIDSEPVDSAALFVTNQGTDAHLRSGELGALEDDRAYRVDGVVASEPETRQGGHVFVDVADAAGGTTLACAAFEPTKRFRDRVRALCPGDRLTVCGEVSDGTLKLEKFAVRELVETEQVTPTCPDCGRRMESAGADQGYRCRDCGTSEPGKVERPVERELEPGWYEVPPVARRHVAKPLIRGGFDAPVHPEG